MDFTEFSASVCSSVIRQILEQTVFFLDQITIDHTISLECHLQGPFFCSFGFSSHPEQYVSGPRKTIEVLSRMAAILWHRSGCEVLSCHSSSYILAAANELTFAACTPLQKLILSLRASPSSERVVLLPDQPLLACPRGILTAGMVHTSDSQHQDFAEEDPGDSPISKAVCQQAEKAPCQGADTTHDQQKQERTARFSYGPHIM